MAISVGRPRRDAEGANPGAPLVEARGLTKRYGARVAVEELSMSMRRGQVYGFLGPDGAGKTTTLRMLLVLRPSSFDGFVRVQLSSVQPIKYSRSDY